MGLSISCLSGRAAQKPRQHLIGPTLVPWKTRAGTPLRPARGGDYGAVRITRGRFGGKLA